MPIVWRIIERSWIAVRTFFVPDYGSCDASLSAYLHRSNDLPPTSGIEKQRLASKIASLGEPDVKVSASKLHPDIQKMLGFTSERQSGKLCIYRVGPLADVDNAADYPEKKFRGAAASSSQRAA